MSSFEDTVEYFKVTYRAIATSVDGPDADDLPDQTPVDGWVKFTPNIRSGGAIKFPDAVPPFDLFPQPRRVQIVDGEIYHEGRGYVMLEAASAAGSPSDWTWTVEFDMRTDIGPVSVPRFDIAAVPNSTVDLVLASPASSPGGMPTALGPRGYSIGTIVVVDQDKMRFILDDPDATALPDVQIPAVTAALGASAEAKGYRDEAKGHRDQAQAYADGSANARDAAEGWRNQAQAQAQQAATIRAAIEQYVQEDIEPLAAATSQDAAATAADRVATGEDRAATGQDAVATAADRVATGEDRAQVAADRTAVGGLLTDTQTARDEARTEASRSETQADRSKDEADRAELAANNAELGVPPSGWQKGDLHADVQGSLDAADSALQEVNWGDVGGKPATFDSEVAKVDGLQGLLDQIDQSLAAKADLVGGKVPESQLPAVKPASGWAKSDLDSGVQTSLGKADSALQEVKWGDVDEKPTTFDSEVSKVAGLQSELDATNQSVSSLSSLVDSRPSFHRWDGQGTWDPPSYARVGDTVLNLETGEIHNVEVG